MRYLVAGLAGGAVFLAISHPRGRSLSARVGDYLKPHSQRAADRPIEGPSKRLREGLTARIIAAAAGVLAGILLAQGDLFIEGPGRAVLPMAALGGLAGWLVVGMYRSSEQERRGRRLRFELPVVADTLALHIVAGESVGTSIAHYVDSSEGVAADELSDVLTAHESGVGLTEALQSAGRITADDEARRFYTLLAHAHDTGGRLAESLIELSADYRAGLSRDLTAEGGKRALATYGPVLALMVPVTLLFLLYPTLAGLRSLAGSP